MNTKGSFFPGPSLRTDISGEKGKALLWSKTGEEVVELEYLSCKGNPLLKQQGSPLSSLFSYFYSH